MVRQRRERGVVTGARDQEIVWWRPHCRADDDAAVAHEPECVIRVNLGIALNRVGEAQDEIMASLVRQEQRACIVEKPGCVVNSLDLSRRIWCRDALAVTST